MSIGEGAHSDENENDIVTIFELSGENILESLDALFTSEYTRIERGLGGVE